MPLTTRALVGRRDLRPSRVSAALIALAIIGVAVEPALAQARNPFSVGISEGGGSATGLTGWLLAQQGWLEHQLSLYVRAARLGSAAVWPLVGLSLVYGVLHAAGPGHGKAVLASYMLANERALRRGVALSFAAALLQGLVATLLIALLTLGLHATAAHVKATASWVETASFLTVALLGLQLVIRKGRGLLQACRTHRTTLSWPGGGSLAPTLSARVVAPGLGAMALSLPHANSRFTCSPAEAAHPADCLHCLGPDPRMLGDERFDLRQATVTVLAAGLRPCSGAILVLVFAVAQGLFLVGALSVLAMSMGVAVTTAALATGAVLFKGVAARFAGGRSPVAYRLGACIEFAAACVVLAAGLLLLAGYAGSGMS